MGAKIGQKSEEGGKKGVQKSMRKKDEDLKVEKSPKHSTLGLRRLGFGAPGGLGGTVKPDLIQISFKTPCTWRGAAEVL